VAVLASRYMAAVLSHFDSDIVDFDLLPTVLALACVDVLRVDGAGLSLIDTLRVPLAASSEDVRRAEQLQITLGEGPCLTAVATAEPLVADAAAMAKEWPIFHHELLAQTPFRAVAALPLALPGEWPFGALDLYLKDSDPDPRLMQDDVSHELAAVITSFLTRAPLTDTRWASEPVASWLGSRSVESRMNVWAGVGLLMVAAALNQAEGLACLRAYAFSHDTTIDVVAEQLTTRQLPATDVTG
jgi:hypothetical protein